MSAEAPSAPPADNVDQAERKAATVPPPTEEEGENSQKEPSPPPPEGRRRYSPPKKERVYPTFHRHVNPNLKPQAMRMHPKGFKILSKRSPLDRAMTTYFRLPPKAPPRVLDEHQKLATVVDKMIAAETKKGVVLDGFVLLEATQVDRPENATHCVINDSNVVGVVREDLAFFGNLTFLDLGENSVSLADASGFPSLQELHLHCNLVKDVELEEGALGSLQTLNLSFNALTRRAVGNLGALPSLERADLSCNQLRDLPRDLSHFSRLTHLALENNRFTKPETLLALGTMPHLREVNLNFNQFTSCPQFPAEFVREEDAPDEDGNNDDDGQNEDPSVEGRDASHSRNGGRYGRPYFPELEVLGLASNRVTYFEDVYNFTQLPKLKRIILWGNPIETRSQDVDILLYEFTAIGIQVVLESPIPPKRKIGDFYKKETCLFRKVPKTDGGGLSLAQQKRRRADGNPSQATASSPVDGAPTAPQNEGATGSSFYVTQQAGTMGAEATEDTAGVDMSQHQQQKAAAPVNPSGGGGAAWFSQSRPREQQAASADSATKRSHRQQHAAASSSVHYGSQSGNAPPAPLVFSGSSTGGVQQQQSGASVLRLSSPSLTQTAATDYAGANTRSVMTELRRMLRQPLPPIHRPNFATAGGGGRNAPGQ